MTGISFDSVSKFYGEVVGLNDVTFSIPKGITGLVGSNGAGKTTTLKMCVALLKPDLGTVTVNDEPIWGNLGYLSRIGYATEKDKLYNWMTGEEFLDWNGKFYQMEPKELETRKMEILELMNLREAKDRRIAGYSRGMRQRIKIGQALLNNPDIIFVDEPMSGTDPLGRYTIAETFRRLQKEEGKSIILSSHVLHELERLSSWVLVLENGKLVAEGTIHGIRLALSDIPQHLVISSPNISQLVSFIVSEVDELKRVDENKIEVAVRKRRNFEKMLLDLQQEKSIEITEFYSVDGDLSSIYQLLKKRDSASWRYIA